MTHMTKDGVLTMDIATTLARPARRRPLSTLSSITVAALAGMALALAYIQVAIIGEFRPDLSLFAGLMLGAAGLIATRWRWTPLVGAGLSAMVVLANSGPVFYDLTHPDNVVLFRYMVVAVSFAVAGTVAGIGATVQNYRGTAYRTPRATIPLLAALIALGAGAILVGSLPRAAGAAISEDVLAQLPAVTTPGFSFDQPEIRVKAGETVAFRLDNPHVAPHSFDIDELNVHVPVAVGGSSLVLFRPTEPGTYTFYCELPGHREEGMQGTLIVE
jgi:plastocyanin